MEAMNVYAVAVRWYPYPHMLISISISILSTINQNLKTIVFGPKGGPFLIDHKFEIPKTNSAHIYRQQKTHFGKF